jgi:hypothetical protein
LLLLLLVLLLLLLLWLSAANSLVVAICHCCEPAHRPKEGIRGLGLPTRAAKSCLLLWPLLALLLPLP